MHSKSSFLIYQFQAATLLSSPSFFSNGQGGKKGPSLPFSPETDIETVLRQKKYPHPSPDIIKTWPKEVSVNSITGLLYIQKYS